MKQSLVYYFEREVIKTKLLPLLLLLKSEKDNSKRFIVDGLKKVTIDPIWTPFFYSVKVEKKNNHRIKVFEYKIFPLTRLYYLCYKHFS